MRRRFTFLILLATAFASAQTDPAGQMLRQAIELQKSGHLAEAVDDYRAFLKVHPEAAPVRSNLGAALADEGHYREAIREYTLALTADPSNAGIRFNMGLAYYKSGDVAQAIQLFQGVYSALPSGDPNHDRVALLLAECFLRQGKNQNVVALLTPLDTADNKDRTLDYLLGTALIHEGQIQQGAVLIQKLLQNGDNADAHMLMAYTRYAAHDKNNALVEVNRAIAIDPSLPEAFSLKGRLEYLESDPADAVAAFRKALALDPNNYDARLWLGTLLRQEGHLKESEANLQRALQLHPKSVRGRFQYARLCSDEGNYARAASVLESLVRDYPGYTEAHRTLVTLYFRLGRKADAEQQMKIVRKMDAEIRARNEAEGKKLTK